MSNTINHKPPVLPPGSFSGALKGEVKIEVGALLKHAWDITPRILIWMIGVFIGVAAIGFVVTKIMEVFMPINPAFWVEGNEATIQIEDLFIFIISSIIQEFIMAPFNALFIMVALVNVIGRKPNMALLRYTLTRWRPIVLCSVVKMTTTAAGVLLLALFLYINTQLAIVLMVLFAIYVQLSFMLAVPLIIDRGLTTSKAIFASVIIINKAMFPILMLMILMFIILMISAIPLGLGLIFTVPMLANLVATIYHSLVGCDVEELPYWSTEVRH